MSNLNKKFIDLNKKLDRMKNDFDKIGESQKKIKNELPGLLKRLQKRSNYRLGGKVKRTRYGRKKG